MLKALRDFPLQCHVEVGTWKLGKYLGSRPVIRVKLVSIPRKGAGKEALTSNSVGTMQIPSWLWISEPANYSNEFTGEVLRACSSSPLVFCWLRESLQMCLLGSPVGVMQEYVKQVFSGCWTLSKVNPRLLSCWWHSSTGSQGAACVRRVSTLGIPELGHHGVVRWRQ